MEWKTLQHNGILFPPEYETRGIKIRIRGQKISLNLIQEEMVYQWAKKKDTPYAKDAVFRKNFFADFVKTLDSEFAGISYADVGFAEAYRLVDKEKDARELMTKEQKKAQAAERKKMREKMKEKYGTAVLDGEKVEVGNYMAEPPGIFIGRGEHPLRGKWKRRIRHGDVTLNLGKESGAPPGRWGKIAHETGSMWLANWIDDLTQKRKYVWLADTAGPKQEKDKAKYEKATMLAKEIEKIKGAIIRDMKNKDPKVGTIATVCYLIYRTAMRVGDEKDPDEADTVGATTLRKEHVKIVGDTIQFDFLGKDSVRWRETIKDGGQFQSNLKKIMEKKKPGDEIFEGITSRHVNKYYRGIVDDLTAKVFRTYLASERVIRYLRDHDRIGSSSPYEKIYHAKLANLEAAIMCNHKRTIPKTFKQALQKKRDNLKRIEGTKPALKSKGALKKAQDSSPKTEKQKKSREERIAKLREQIRRQKARHAERVEKVRLQIDLVEKTRDYNIGTSLRNYIDPRIFKAWTDEVGAEWEKLYTAALQKKFLWVKKEKGTWKKVSKQY